MSRKPIPMYESIAFVNELRGYRNLGFENGFGTKQKFYIILKEKVFRLIVQNFRVKALILTGLDLF